MNLEYCRAISFLSAGAPHENLSKGMEDEHCTKAGCTDNFDTSNYGVRTNPLKEYEIATGRRACPAEDMLDKEGKRVRVVKRIDALKVLKLATKAGLTEDEILAVVRPPPALTFSLPANPPALQSSSRPANPPALQSPCK